MDTLPGMQFDDQVRKPVVACFDGGEITSDAGLLLLSQADTFIGLSRAIAQAMGDSRQPGKIEHSLESLVAERVLGIAAGYPDANDLDLLRRDPALKIACSRLPQSEGDLASQPTISRLENKATPRQLLRMGRAIAKRVISQLPEGTRQVVLDLDATDDPCHGQQEFEGFNRYYDNHCYLPLYLHVADERGEQRLLASLLRPGRSGSTKGVGGLLRIAVRLLRQRFPGVRILLRADCGFGCAEVLRICERLKIDFLLGLSSNSRLVTLSIPTQIRCALKHKWEGDGCREYGEFAYKAGTWRQRYRVMARVEITRGELNPRYVVTNLPGAEQGDGAAVAMAGLEAEAIYKLYCARGDQENRIKEMKLDLESGRTSCHRFWANQCRLLWHTAAGVLMGVLQSACHGTRWAKAQVGTLRLRLLKVGARIVESCRRVCVHLASSFPEKETWFHLHEKLSCETA